MDSILERAFDAWTACGDLRQRRHRYKRFAFGDQWADPVQLPSGKWVTEGEMASQDGKRPLTNNVIRQLLKSVTGRFRSRMAAGDSAIGRGVDPPTARRNHLDELDSRSLEEFLISGCVIQRVVNERRIGGDGVWVDIVSPEKFFVNRFTDPRSHDIELIGMLHDLTYRELEIRYGRDSRSLATLAAIYGGAGASASRLAGLPAVGDAAAGEFYHAPAGRCRVIEVWTLENRRILKCHDTADGSLFILAADSLSDVERLNHRRRRHGEPLIEIHPTVTMRWHARFLTPTGVVLDEYDSPYAHSLHPFAVKLYPMIDGEVHSFVEDVIDRQRHVNRLITLIDHIMGVSAKGVLLFPEEQRVPGMTWEQVAEMWSDCNGVLPYRVGKLGNVEPHQVVSSGNNAGASELLQLELRLLEQVSGVSGALQGHNASGSSSAALYEAQADNSELNLLDLFDAFDSFRTMRDHKISLSS